MTEVDRFRDEVKLEIQALLCTEKGAIPSSRLFGIHHLFFSYLKSLT